MTIADLELTGRPPRGEHPGDGLHRIMEKLSRHIERNPGLCPESSHEFNCPISVKRKHADYALATLEDEGFVERRWLGPFLGDRYFVNTPYREGDFDGWADPYE